MSFDDEFDNNEIIGAIGSDEPEEVVNLRSETPIEDTSKKGNARQIRKNNRCVQFNIGNNTKRHKIRVRIIQMQR